MMEGYTGDKTLQLPRAMLRAGWRYCTSSHLPSITCGSVTVRVCICERERRESGGSACHNALILSDIYPMEATLIHPSITFHPFLPSFALRFMSFPHSLLVASDRQSNRARIPSTPPRTHALRNIALSMNCCIVAPKAQFK